MTPQQIVDSIRARAAGRASSVFDTPWYLDRANDGYRDLVTFYDQELRKPLRFPHFESILDTTITAPPPNTNFFAITDPQIFTVIAMRDLDAAQSIPERPGRELDEANPADTGRILKYAVSGNGTSTLGIRYWKRNTAPVNVRFKTYLYPETLTISGPPPIIPEVWHRCIALFGAAEAADQQENPDRRDELLTLAVNFVRTHRSPTQETRRRRRHLAFWRRFPAAGVN